MSAPGAIDTIVAPATAAGGGERAVVRLSGPRAWSLAAQVVEPEGPLRAGHAAPARWALGDGLHLPVLLLPSRAPRSFTGEDVVEVHLRAWPPLVTGLVAALVEAGARPAERGEFTRRAVACGRLEWAQGLAVGRLASAATAEEAAAAAAALDGALAARHEQLREALLAALASIEAHVDFEDDDTEAIGEDDLRAALGRARATAAALLAVADAAPPRDGETDVALVGAPNAGKSSLLLALCPGASTSVSPVAGTTRDMLEARIEHGGRRWRLLDGPGLDLAGAGPSDLDRRAMELFVRNVPSQAVLLVVRDAVAEPADAPLPPILAEALAAHPAVTVWNKGDRIAPAPARPGLVVSALQRQGLPALWSALHAAAPAPRAPDLLAREERRAVADVADRLDGALTADLAGALPEVALVLREAIDVLDATHGHVADVPEEVLDRIFASFCLGK